MESLKFCSSESDTNNVPFLDLVAQLIEHTSHRRLMCVCGGGGGGGGGGSIPTQVLSPFAYEKTLGTCIMSARVYATNAVAL